MPADLADLLQRRQHHCPGRLVSLDLPAGLDSDTGCPMEGGAAIASDTLCVGLIKRGLVQDAALAHVGRLHRIDLAVPMQLTQSLVHTQSHTTGAMKRRTLLTAHWGSEQLKWKLVEVRTHPRTAVVR